LTLAISWDPPYGFSHQPKINKPLWVVASIRKNSHLESRVEFGVTTHIIQLCLAVLEDVLTLRFEIVLHELILASKKMEETHGISKKIPAKKMPSMPWAPSKTSHADTVPPQSQRFNFRLPKKRSLSGVPSPS